ncbi:MAG: tetratricopeptide repeat protein [Chloroflexi bacterium]|nr:tetratricopeptide repeat protein [Chloroflexota bacterium]
MSESAQLLRQVRLALQNQDYPLAIRCLEQAVEIAHSLGDTSAEGRHLGNLGLIYYRIGQAEKALEYFELALARARAEHDRATEDGLLGNMGNILRELKRYDAALEYLNQALLIAQEIGDVRGRGLWLGNLGLLYDDLKQYAKAAELHAQAAEIARQLQDARGLVTRLGNLGQSRVATADYAAALEAFREAAKLCEELGDASALMRRLSTVGDVQYEMARAAVSDDERSRLLHAAMESYRYALDTTAALGDGTGHTPEQIRLHQAQLLRAIGVVLADLGQTQRAAECFAAAARFFGLLGMESQRAEAEQRQAALTKRRSKVEN